MRSRLGTPGVAVMLAGLALLYWGTGILRNGGGDDSKIIRRNILGSKNTRTKRAIPKDAE